MVDKLGEETILYEMAKTAISKFYPTFIKEKKIDAIGTPAVTITKLARNNPLGFKLKTAVVPQFTLGDYRSLIKPIVETPISSPEVSTTEIEQVIKDLEKFDPEKLKLEGLREKIGQGILNEKIRQGKEKRRLEVVEKIITSLNLTPPPLLIEHELDHLMTEVKADTERIGLSFDEYLSRLKKTEPDLREGFREQAMKRVKIGLVLSKIAEQEKLSDTEQVWQFLEKPL